MVELKEKPCGEKRLFVATVFRTSKGKCTPRILGTVEIHGPEPNPTTVPNPDSKMDATAFQIRERLLSPITMPPDRNKINKGGVD